MLLKITYIHANNSANNRMIYNVYLSGDICNCVIYSKLFVWIGLYVWKKSIAKCYTLPVIHYLCVSMYQQNLTTSTHNISKLIYV